MLDSSNFELEGYMTFWMSLHNNVGVKIRKDYNKRSSKRKKRIFERFFFRQSTFEPNASLSFRFINNVRHLISILIDYANGIESSKFVFSWLVSKRFDHPISQPVMSIHVPHVPSVISISKGLSFNSDRHRFLPNPFSCVLQWTVWLVWLPETNQNNT